MIVYKSMKYHMEIPDEVRKDFEFMTKKQLSDLELKLAQTPEDFAARYVRYVLSSLGTEAVSPLPGWLKMMDDDCQKRYRLIIGQRVFQAAERQVFILIGLYFSTFLWWKEEFCAALQLDCTARPYEAFGQRIPKELSERLVEQRQGLLACADALQIVEQDYLHDALLPADLRIQLDPGRLHFFASAEPSRKRCGKTRVQTPAKRLEEARAKVATLLATARATASMTHCNQLILNFAQARLTLRDRLSDWELSMSAPDKASATLKRKSPHGSSAAKAGNRL